MKNIIKHIKVQKSKVCITCGKRKLIEKFSVRSENGKRRNSCNQCEYLKKLKRNKKK